MEKLHKELAHAFEYVYLDLEAAKSYKKRILAHKSRVDLRGRIQQVIKRAQDFKSNRNKSHLFLEPGFGRELVGRLADKKNVDDVMRQIIPEAAAVAVAQSQAVSSLNSSHSSLFIAGLSSSTQWVQMMHFHLSANHNHWDKIAMHARPKGDFEELKRCVLEG